MGSCHKNLTQGWFRRPVQGVPYLLPSHSCDRFQQALHVQLPLCQLEFLDISANWFSFQNLSETEQSILHAKICETCVYYSVWFMMPFAHILFTCCTKTLNSTWQKQNVLIWNGDELRPHGCEPIMFLECPHFWNLHCIHKVICRLYFFFSMENGIAAFVDHYHADVFKNHSLDKC